MPVMVRFRAGDGAYAVPVERTLEVRPADDVVALPSPAPGVAGVIERGEQSIPVVRALGDPTNGPGGSPHAQVLVVEGLDGAVGLLVEEVTGVTDVDSDSIGPPPPGQGAAYVGAVVREGSGVTFVLDVEEVTRSFVRSGEGLLWLDR